jgi:hypothetical protein
MGLISHKKNQHILNQYFEITKKETSLAGGSFPT